MDPYLAYFTHFMSLLVSRRRDERGLSQSTENALLVAGAVTVASLIVLAVTAYVKSNLSGLK